MKNLKQVIVQPIEAVVKSSMKNTGNVTIPQEILDAMGEENVKEMLEAQKQVQEATTWVSNFGVQHRFKSFARNIDINRPKRKIKHEFGVGGGSYTDNVMMRTSLDEDWVPRGKEDWVRFMKFVIAHEMAHVNWSDFHIFKKFQMRAESYFEKKHDIKGAGRFAGELLNITEDGRIERALINVLPGLLKYVKYTNGVMYEGFNANQLGIVPLHDFRNIALTLSKVGLLPEGYSKRIAGTETDEAIKKAQPYIAKAIRATTAKEAADATWDMIIENEDFLVEAMQPFEIPEELLQQMLEEDLSDDDNQDDGQDGQGFGPGISNPSLDEDSDDSDDSDGSESNGENGEDSENEDSNDSKGSSKNSDEESEDEENSGSSSNDDNKEDAGEEGDEEGSQGDDSSDKKEEKTVTINPLDNMEGEPDYENSPSMGSAPQGDASAHFGNESDMETGEAKAFSAQQGDGEETDGDMEATLDELVVLTHEDSIDFLDKAKQAASRENDRIEREEAERSKYEASQAEFNGVLSEYLGHKDFAYTEEVFEDNGPVREDIKRTGRGLRRDLEEIFNDKRGWTLANQRTGMLDESQLWRAGAAIQQNDVFIKRQLPEDSSWIVSILVDNSGSMNGAVRDSMGNFLGNKTKIAREATATLEIALNGLVPIKITRFDSYGSTVQHARVRGWEQKTKEILSWNSTDYSGSMNADAMSIGVAVEELKKRPETKKLLIVLSDGLPSANTPEQVNKVVENSRKEGVKVVGIGFGPEQELENNKDTYQFMYGQDLVLTMPDGLSKELVKVLRGTIARG